MGLVYFKKVNGMPVHKEDPAVDKFLEFLDNDIQKHPERLKLLDADLLQRIQSLVGDAKVDLDQPLPAED